MVVKIFLFNMKLEIQIVFTCLVINISHSFVFKDNSDNSGCRETEECRPLSECPAGLTNLKDNHIRPKICSFQTRSVSICCSRRDIVPTSQHQKCGLRKKVKTFPP